MKIIQVDIANLDVPIRHAISTPRGTITAAHNVVVKLTTDSGIYGWGEASPFAAITGDSQQSNYLAATQLAEILLGQDALAIESRVGELFNATCGEPSLVSAFDMAFYDIAAKAAGMPLYQFLGGQLRELRTDMTIGLQTSVADTLAQAQEVLAAGFVAIKLKVGRDGLKDVEHVAAVRELAGADIAIRIDANQGWDLPTALASLRAMQSLNLDYVEQPLAAWNVRGLAELRQRQSIPVCADESLFSHIDALNLAHMAAADYLNIKLGKAGGIFTALKISAVAEAAGLKCMIGCFAESRLGVSAAAHLALARGNIHFIDLDTAYQFRQDPIRGGVHYAEQHGGLMQISDRPGHGAEVDESGLRTPYCIRL
ncbi:L-Ala-D/L-Glu epimerase [Bowmanella denitrificans]|uniref:Dipeptide epimerase n=1 Tax=Bowmanella denitrificans TaxID=366582 RepID=A0ABN0XTI5_9ALTE